MSPTRSLRACRVGACPHPAVSRGRCAVHAPADEQQRHRYGARIYNDKRWRGRHGLRAQVLAQQPLCTICLEQHRVTLATVVDHRIPHRGDERLAFDIDNLRPLCAFHHGQVTAAAMARNGVAARVTIVSGPPRSGKTTYVDNRRRPGDLVWDMDAIAQTLAQCPTYPRPPHVTSCLHTLRSALVQWLNATHVTAYVIVTNATEAQELATHCRAAVVNLQAPR